MARSSPCILVLALLTTGAFALQVIQDPAVPPAELPLEGEFAGEDVAVPPAELPLEGELAGEDVAVPPAELPLEGELAGEDVAVPPAELPLEGEPAGEDVAVPPAELPLEGEPAGEDVAVPPAELPLPAEGDLAATPSTPQGRICKQDFHPFQAVKTWKKTTFCSVYCLPTGTCTGMAQTGKLASLGRLSTGGCRKDGYTETFRVANETRARFARIRGACMGMTQHNFVKPGTAPKIQATPSFGPHMKICQGKMMAYEAHHPSHPKVCAVYCVPEGKCEGLVQSGKLQLGITVQGNCRGRGFTKPSTDYGLMGEDILDMLKGFKGACQGMTYAKFEKPEV